MEIPKMKIIRTLNIKSTKPLMKPWPVMRDRCGWMDVTFLALIPTDALLNIVLFGKDTQQSFKVLSRGIAPPKEDNIE
jgi:hypothetical protein